MLPNSLRQQNQVLLAVPSVDILTGILTGGAATQLVANPDNPKLVAVRQDFAGAFSGRALLIFPERNSLELVRAVVGRELPISADAAKPHLTFHASRYQVTRVC